MTGPNGVWDTGSMSPVWQRPVSTSARLLLAALRRPYTPLALVGLAVVAALVGYGVGAAVRGASSATVLPPGVVWIGPLDDPVPVWPGGAAAAGLVPADHRAASASDETSRSPAYEESLPAETYEPANAATADQPPPTSHRPVTPPAARPNGTPLDEPAWRRFAATAPERDGRPMVAVVVDDLGMDRRRTARTIGLAGPLTLSFLPYAGDLPEQTARARGGGHELLVHVGMEPTSGSVDPGPNVLLTGLAAEETRRRLIWGLERFGGYVGINNHMGSRFTADAAGMAVVMEELHGRGLLYLDSRTTPATVGPEAARQAGVPFAERSVFLDPLGGVATVKDQLAEAEGVARRRGVVVAIGHPHDATLDALEAWLPGLEARGLVLAPLSAVVAAHGAPPAERLHISKR